MSRLVRGAPVSFGAMAWLTVNGVPAYQACDSTNLFHAMGAAGTSIQGGVGRPNSQFKSSDFEFWTIVQGSCDCLDVLGSTTSMTGTRDKH
jgi:hypothetical protein